MNSISLTSTRLSDSRTILSFSQIAVILSCLFLFSSCKVPGSDDSSSGGGTSTPNTDTTAPTTSYSLSPSTNCTITGTSVVCTGPVTLTLTSSESGTVYSATQIGSDTTATTASTAGSSILIKDNNLYIDYFSRDSAGNSEATHNKLYFTFQGIQATLSDGTSLTNGQAYYYNQHKSFYLEVSSDRSLSDYQIWYRKNDTTADQALGSVFTANVPNEAGSPCYQDNNDNAQIPFPGTNGRVIDLPLNQQTTVIHEFKYNLLYGGTWRSCESSYILDGSTDSDISLTIYMDNDYPNLLPLPPSTGSLDTTIDLLSYHQDDGYDIITAAQTTNTSLTGVSTPDASYCVPTEGTDDIESQTFWTSCQNTTQTITTASDSSTPNSTILSLTADTIVPFTVRDKASNPTRCYSNLYSCKVDPLDNNASVEDSYLVEQYTPGKLQTQLYHEEQIYSGTAIRNFGHSIAVGNLDNDGSTDNDIVIGAPAYSTILSDSSNVVANGAIYIWYNNFRERAERTFTLGAASLDISSTYIDISTDGNEALRIYLDPSNDTSYDSYTPTGSAGKFIAKATEYNDKTSATSKEIANVLNRAFLASLGEKYSNPLFAVWANETDASSSITLGHRNKTLQGYFVYASFGFPSSSDFSYQSPDTGIRAYDMMYYGENQYDEFGYSVSINKVDTSTDSVSNIVVGAPGYNSAQGAVYVISPPTSSTAANYSDTAASTSHKIFGEASTTGRFGMTLLTADLYGSTTDSELVVSAPSLSSRGAVYYVQELDYADNSTDTIVSTGWAKKILGETDRPNFGYSLVYGAPSFGTKTARLFIGAPGEEYNATAEGEVYYIQVNGTDPTNDWPSNITKNSLIPKPSDEQDLPSNLFGYSLTIITSPSFDTSSITRKCPCLVVGSPGANSDKGRVYLIGDNGLTTLYLEGSEYGEKMGVAVASGKVASNDITQSLMISSRGLKSQGKLTYVKAQTLVQNSTLTATSNVEGSYRGGRFGSSLLFMSRHIQDDVGNHKKALFVGSSGQGEEDSSNRNFRIGGVSLYSGERIVIDATTATDDATSDDT